jgi:hypothetical protein
MSEQLGKIDKLSAEEYLAGRKLYFVPLVFPSTEPIADVLEKVNRYWDQVESQVANLESKLGNVHKIYHELIPLSGEDGMKSIEELNKGSYRIVKSRLDKGAELQPIEDGELLAEFMDWSRCLAVGLQSQKAFATVYESYVQAQKKRNGHIAKQIDETLKDSEAGILLLREGHQVQFPSDIQVFYVAPPGLDEIKRWLRQREAEAQTGNQTTQT